jgi:hypothetical protein
MTPKAEALVALGEVRRILNAPEVPAALALAQVRATLDYAASCVERIDELKRKRKGAKP